MLNVKLRTRHVLYRMLWYQVISRPLLPIVAPSPHGFVHSPLPPRRQRSCEILRIPSRSAVVIAPMLVRAAVKAVDGGMSPPCLHNRGERCSRSSLGHKPSQCAPPSRLSLLSSRQYAPIVECVTMLKPMSTSGSGACGSGSASPSFGNDRAACPVVDASATRLRSWMTSATVSSAIFACRSRSRGADRKIGSQGNQV